MKTRTVAALSLVLAAGCTPQHGYTPPDTLEGKACIARCQDALERCTGDHDEPRGLGTTPKCADESQESQLQCPPGVECPRVPCRYVPEDGACGEDYRACYRDCGGSVDDR
jgi:hypothetical protein